MHVLFHLVRHAAYPLIGKVLGGRADHTLSADGRAAADRVGVILQERRPSAVLTSPVQRARETAEVIAQHVECEVQIEDAFSEIDYANWTGRSFADLHDDASWRSWNSFRSTAEIPGGETMLLVQARAVAALVRYANTHVAGELVVVSHADVIKAVLAHFLGAPLDLMHRWEIAPASISQLVLYDNDAQILAVNA
ncbi:MAG TPA: histidine phosphatase family protein [Acetobacteraceae bacterium]|nr:histidine phosphatase family protein [Acetobacteraceae bacterium]